MASVGVGLPLQIHDRNQGNIYKAQAELIEAHRELERVQLALQDRLAAVFKDYLSARQQTEQYKAVIVPDAKTPLSLDPKRATNRASSASWNCSPLNAPTPVSHWPVCNPNGNWFRARRKSKGLLLTGALDGPAR